MLPRFVRTATSSVPVTVAVRFVSDATTVCVTGVAPAAGARDAVSASASKAGRTGRVRIDVSFGGGKKETQQHEAPAHGAPLPGPEPHASCVPMRVKLQPGEISKLSFSGGVAVGNARSTEWEGAFLSRRPEGTWTEIEGRRPGAPARHAATITPRSE